MSLVDLTYNFECDWLAQLSNEKLSNNKLSNNKLSDNKLSDNKLSDNNLAGEVENSFFSKPITIEKILMVMINRVIPWAYSNFLSLKSMDPITFHIVV